jgi:hypothetical protein
MSKFKVGEVAIYVGSGIVINGPHKGEKTPYSHGDEVEILEVKGALYRVDQLGGNGLWAMEENLRKKNPPASPFSFQEIIDMCNDKTITTPTEETIKRVMENMGRLYGT